MDELMYKLHVIKATKDAATALKETGDTDGGYNLVETYESTHKPTFEDMYKRICCTTIEMSKAYYPMYSNRKDGYVDIYFDEEFLMKDSEPNIGATVAWKKWQDKTGHTSLPGSILHGTVCVIQKEEKYETA